MRSIEFFSGNREVVRGVLFEPTAPRRHPGIIFAHGLLSSHEEFGEYPARFCDRGYLVLAIDFRGHGASDGMRGLSALPFSGTAWAVAVSSAQLRGTHGSELLSPEQPSGDCERSWVPESWCYIV
jgi:pimeloyl-ACP methyl ester carboxylesterase